MIKSFPHYSDASKRDACNLLTAKFGDTGYAFWFRLLEYLNQNDADPLDLNDENRLFAFALYCHPTQRDFIQRRDQVLEILNFCAAYADDDGDTLIDSKLWLEEKKLWSRKNRENVDSVLKRRKEYTPEVNLDTPEFRFATKMFEDIASVYPAMKRLDQLQRKRKIIRWVPILPKIATSYRTNIEEMTLVWNWLHRSNHKDALFWRKVIRGADKFYKHFEVLLERSQAESSGKITKPSIFNRPTGSSELISSDNLF